MKKTYDAILLLSMSLFWAINYPLVKVAVIYENEFYVIFFRILFALIVSLIIFPGAIKINKSLKTQLKIFVVSMLNIVSFMEFWFIGEMYESASVSSIIIYSYPLIIVFLSILFLNEKIKLLNISGLLIGFMGIIFVFSSQFNIHNYLGLVFLLLSSLSWSFGTIFYKKYLNNVEPASVNLLQFFYALPVTLLIALVSGPLVIKTFDFNFILITFYMGSLGTSVAYFIYFYLYRKYSVSKISSYLFLVPAMAVLISVYFFKEALTTFNIIGLLFIMVGIYISQK